MLDETIFNNINNSSLSNNFKQKQNRYICRNNLDIEGIKCDKCHVDLPTRHNATYVLDFYSVVMYKLL